MVWQDFWLANPGDGPEPEDIQKFNDVPRRYVRRIRNHPSICLYCGRDQGYPPEPIDFIYIIDTEIVIISEIR